jgi:hypothetical protein
MKMVSILGSAIVATIVFAGAAVAQTPAPAPSQPPAAAAKPAPTAKPAAAAKPSAAQRQALSKECSAQADAKGLHGKERKTFRSDCKRNGGKS